MVKTHKDQKGFSAPEGLLILVIIGLIAFVGWYVWHSKNTVDNTLRSTNKTSSINTGINHKQTNSYAGWKLYTLKAERLSLKYPSTWNVKEADNGSTLDNVYISAPDEKFGLNIMSGAFSGAQDNYASAPVYSEKVNVLGQERSLNYYAAGASSGSVGFAALTTSPNAGASNILDKYVALPNGGNYLMLTIAYADTDTSSKPLTTFQHDPNLKLAKLILRSLAY